MTSPQDAARALPIYAHEDEILDAIKHHRVVVVEGPTGCGKTTQLPRILHQGGLAKRMIGVTQPRRIAAVSVAWRIAVEQECELGEDVGYAIRFDDKTSPKTVIKIMTDGILLQEARSDPLFGRYDIIIIDEAHERSLNIDLTLGLLHRALGRRDDLRVIISSATLDPAHFQRFFAGIDGDVPLVSIQARTHPIEVLHRPPPEDWYKGALADAVADAVMEIHRTRGPGHILAFLTGEGMIHDTERGLVERGAGAGLAVVPLYGRLTREEQERAFDDVGERRKVVLATNIAETSITIAGVRYVIDTGLAKIPRFDGRTGITTLREEPISQASVAQRSGRAGRTAPGVAVLLYDEASMKSRPMFTDEEVRRRDLAEVLLRLIDIGVRDVEDFPMPTPLPRARVRTAIDTLTALGAIDKQRRLTDIGVRMVPFPLEPRLARMVIEAADKYPKVVDDVLVVGAFLSSRSPYLFPSDEQAEARRAQDALAHGHGDAVTAVGVFRRWQRARDRKGFCSRSYLDPDIMEFLEKTRSQLAEIATGLGVHVVGGGPPDDIVRAVAVGFPDRILARRGRSYESITGAKVSLHPSSVLFRANHHFVVAAEIVRSRRVYARHVSMLRPEWVGELSVDAAHHFKIGRKGGRTKRKEPMTRGSVPENIRIGSVDLRVFARKDRVRIDIPFAAVEELRSATLDDLPAGAATWRARIMHGAERYLTGRSLAEVIALLPFVPLPDGKPLHKTAVPQAMLFTVERNLHIIERHLPKVLLPAKPLRGKRSGWLMFVTNKGGGYWFEVTKSYEEAVAVTAAALEVLVEELPDDDSAVAGIEHQLTQVQEQRDKVEAALVGARRWSKKGGH